MHYRRQNLHFRPEFALSAPAALIASRIHAALAHRAWAIGPEQRCHLFLIGHGRAALIQGAEAPVPLAAPALLWLPPGTRARVDIMAGTDGFTASASTDFVARAIAAAPAAPSPRPPLGRTVIGGPGLAPHWPALQMSFEALTEEQHQRLPGAAAIMALHLGLLLIHLWRDCGPHDETRRGTAPSTAQRFGQLVELHYRDNWRVQDFASRLNVTRSHLHEACVRATGKTPLALVHDRLLAEARARLEQTGLSVEQVGYGIGFRDPGYFNRFFRRMTGQPPGAFRRAALANRAQPAPSFAAWP